MKIFVSIPNGYNIFKMTREEEIELLRKERIEKLNRLFKDNDM